MQATRALQGENDNEPKEPGWQVPSYAVDAGSIDAQYPALEAVPQQADAFLEEHRSPLFRMLLQGQLVKLENNAAWFKNTYQHTSATTDRLCDLLDEILDRQQPFDACRRDATEALKPYFGGNGAHAEEYFAYYLLQGLACQRMALIANGRIDGFHTFFDEGYTDEQAVTMRIRAMKNNSEMLESMMVSGGVGEVQAKQLLRGFDTATEQAVATFTGAGKGRV